MPSTGLHTTLHLFTVSPSRVPLALLRMAVDRRALRRTPGLTFAKLVGTGDGRTFTIRDANPCRWGLFAVWDRVDSARRFEDASPVMHGWGALADEQWRVDLVALRSRGQWAGREPFQPASLSVAPADAPVAAVTRARLRWRQARRFWASVPPVSADLSRQPGLRYTIGFGEAPIGLQGTFSLWDSAAALSAFAYSGAPHRHAIDQTHRLNWYREELFARFVVVDSQGTIDGVNPLAAAGVPADA